MSDKHAHGDQNIGIERAIYKHDDVDFSTFFCADAGLAMLTAFNMKACRAKHDAMAPSGPLSSSLHEPHDLRHKA